MSPVIFVTKKDFAWNIVRSTKPHAKVRGKGAYPLLRIDDILDALRRSQYFSTLDLYSRHYQVKKDSNDIDKTTFVMQQGQFWFTVMPFGLCNRLATFERLME